jgi:PAS domain S-box-containing protein
MRQFQQDNLKIAQKGLILGFVPLVLILISLGIVIYALDRAESETKRQARAKLISDDVTLLDQSLFEAIGGISTFAVTRESTSLQRYNNAAALVKTKFNELRDLVKNEPDQVSLLNHMQFVDQQMFVILEEIKKAAIEHERAVDLFVIVGLRTRIHGLCEEYLMEGVNFRKAQDAIEARNPPDPERARALVKQLAIFGALVSAAVSFVLTFLFSKSITSRIKVIDDNAHLFAANRPLNPVLSGSDEVADLDRVFHKMAGALNAAAHRERAILDNAVDVICSVDSNNRFREVSSAATRIWGYTPEDLIGSRLSDIILPDDLPTMTTAQSKLIESATSISCETRVKRKDGTTADMLWSMNWASEEKTYFCVAHDITERKNVERIKQEFLQMISHDVRSPLTSVQGTIALMATGAFGEFNEKGRTTVDRAYDSVNRIVCLVDGLLDLDKLEVGKMQMEMNAVDLNSVVSRSVHSVSYLADKQHITIKTPSEPLEIFADGPKLIQVIVNLLSNAIKFSPDNSTITVDYKEIPNFVEVRIKDEGRGIPAKHMSEIFERFSQVQASDHSEKGGKGLGLAICKSIIEAHGGSIGVDSEEGKGSTFWFTIPQPE